MADHTPPNPKPKIGDTKESDNPIVEPRPVEPRPPARLCTNCTFSTNAKADRGTLWCRLDPLWIEVGHMHFCFQFEPKLRFLPGEIEKIEKKEEGE